MAKSSFASSIAAIVFSSSFLQLAQPVPNIFTLASIGDSFVVSSSTKGVIDGPQPHPPFPNKISFNDMLSP
ncbi:hypothetical protein Bint_2433 [Brachyspira intermedia PWS/A]|uniref:Uncharacterized protein n=1 Tax=Brachyspira intermedia (strain ATCC 51140 / PWS/A) TaxID=1045858 RepID=G0EN77_BRAIP|nr:hypothetical protein Bint_2433 [Brachyspira intermedia PWS/A]